MPKNEAKFKVGDECFHSGTDEKPGLGACKVEAVKEGETKDDITCSCITLDGKHAFNTTPEELSHGRSKERTPAEIAARKKRVETALKAHQAAKKKAEKAEATAAKAEAAAAAHPTKAK